MNFALFAGHNYYPEGGASDFRSFGSIEELKELYSKSADEWSRKIGSYADPWGQIVEIETMKILWEARGHEWTTPTHEPS